MEIALTEKCPDDRLCIEPGKYLGLPATEIIVFDTNILFPAIFPQRIRKPTVIEECCRKRGYKSSSKLHGRLKNIREQEKRVKVVNNIEKGEFHRHGIYPAITNSVHGDLKYFERVFEVTNIEKWKKKVRDFTYNPILSVETLRNCYPVISETFSENSDFSVAMAAYLLGCDLATDDYTSFNVGSINRLKKIHFEKWGPEKRFCRHDSDSLLMLFR